MLGGTLNAASADEGGANFTRVPFSATAGDRTLSFSATGLTGVNSATVTITAGTGTQLTVTTQPSSTAQSGVPFAQQPVIQVRDASGNPVSEGSSAVYGASATGGGTRGGNLT